MADKYGVEPPELVKLEKSTKIRWQDLIKLSMKRNSSGEALTVAAISSTVGEIQEEVNKADQEGLSLERSSSVVKKWKSFTRTSLKSRGEVVSPDPTRIFDEVGTPDSMLSDTIGSPDSTINIVEEVPETQEEVDNSTSEEKTFHTAGETSSDQDLDIGFEEITEDLQTDKSEVVLTLEEVTIPDDENMTVEELSLDLDSQEIGISVEQNLVEAVHALPDIDVVQEEKPTSNLETTEVALELEAEDVAAGETVNISVEENLVEAVHTQPVLGSPDGAEVEVTLDVNPGNQGLLLA